MKRSARSAVAALLALLTACLAAEEPIVYVTASGTRYHAAGCSYLTSSAVVMPLSEAARRGLEPCTRCSPPAPPAAAEVRTATPPGLYRVDLAGLRSYRDADFARMLRAKVTLHVDGDTVHVSMSDPPPGLRRTEKVRMLGVDTPETVHPQRPVERFGREASEYTKNRFFDREVFLAFDWDLRDQYGRLLAYIYLPDGSCHNADIVRLGFGHAYTRFPFQFLEEFRDLERRARASRAGLWAE